MTARLLQIVGQLAELVELDDGWVASVIDGPGSPRVDWVSSKFLERSGLTPAQLRGDPQAWRIAVSDDGIAGWLALRDHLRAAPGAFTHRWELRTAQGALGIWSAGVAGFEGGTLQGVFVSFPDLPVPSDVTRDDGAPTFVVVDSTLRVVLASARAQRTTGRLWGREIAAGDMMLDFIRAEDRGDFERDATAALAGEGTSLIRSVPFPGGTVRRYEMSFTPLVVGTARAFVFAAVDITEARRAREHLHVLAAALAHTQDGVVITDVRGGRSEIVFANAAALGGRTLSALRAGVEEELAANSVDPILQEIADAVAAGRGGSFVYDRTTPDGARLAEEISLSPVSIDGGPVTHYVSIQRDILPRLERDAEYKRSDTILSSLPMAVLEIDAERRIRSVRGGARRLLGEGAQQGERFDALLEEASPLLIEAIAGMARGEVTDVSTHEQTLATGSRAVCRVLPGTAGHALVLLEDVSERRALERQLESSRRLEALAHVAAGYAHDVNNLLTSISLGLEALRLQLRAGNDPSDDLQALESAAATAIALGSQVVSAASSRRGRRVVELRSLVAGTVRIATRSLGRRVRVALELDEGCTVEAGPGQLDLVVLNLLLNARDAMPSGGDIWIRLERQAATCLLEVRDSGEGMSPEMLARLYEPFFTTKEHGNGLGLATARKIVLANDGEIHVESSVGQGTCFRVLLPLAHPEPTAVPPTTRGLRVLLVEDESMLAGLWAQFLVRAGHQVRTARSMASALVEAREPVDLLVADFGLPDGDGDALARELRGLWPAARVLLMSGSGHVERVAAEFDGVLRKPCSSAAFLDAVDRVARLGPRVP